MLRVSRGCRFVVGLALVGLAAVGTAGCVLVPAPVPVAAPVVVVPHAVVVPFGHHGYWRGGYRRG